MHSFTLQFTCALFFSLYLNTSILAQNHDTVDFTVPFVKNYSSKKLVRLTPRSLDEVSLIAEELPSFTNDSIDFWTEPNSMLSPVDFLIDESLLPNVREFTRARNMTKARIILDDVQGAVDASVKKTMRFAEYRSDNDLEWFFRDFRRLSAIHDYMHQLANAYPRLVTVDSLGQSFEKRDLKIILISSNSNRKSKSIRGRVGSKQIIFIDAGIHAREWVAPPTALYLAYSLVSKYGKDKSITRIVDAFDWIILPSANPDGYEYTHTNDRMWRKTRSRSDHTQCRGVDPNRNFNFHWRESGSSNRPCAETYAGEKAFSELESSSIAQFLWDNRASVRVYMSLHAFSQMWLYPWGYKKGRTNNNQALERKAKVAVNAIKKISGTNFKIGPSGAILYPAAGGSDDWALGKCGIPYAFTVELRPGPGSSNGFLLPPSEIKPCGVEITAGIVALVNDVVNDGDATY